MHLDILPREDTDCPPGAIWFACSMGDFRGCCSEDPCEAGRCKRDHVDLTILPTERVTASAEGSPMTTSAERDSGIKSETTRWPFESSEDETMSTNAITKDLESKTMTDSGTTHTIPNNNRVTVTKHTLIITDKAPTPISTSIISSPSHLWSTILPSSGATPTETISGNSPGSDTSSSPSTGMIAGVAIGGAIALGICTFLLIRLFRRRRTGVTTGMGIDGRFSIEDHQDSGHGEKSFLQALSPHNTGTQGTRGRSDPFAPFGGRADMPDDPLRPPSDTFEMDGTSTAPAELPAENHNNSRSSIKHYSKDGISQQHAVQPAGPADPRANLNASTMDRRQNTYVNHWNQYRNLGPEHQS